MDLLIDTSTGDLVFTNGECPVTRSNFDVVAQRLKIRLKTFKGEWFINTEYGVPYFQRILGRKPRKQEIDNIFQEQILLEEGVVQINEFNSTFTNGIYTLRFNVINDKTLISPTIEITTPV